MQGLGNCYAAGKPSDERECSEKLHIQSYLEMLGSETGCFWTIGEQYYIGYYPIRYYRKIKVYRVEIMDMRNVAVTPLFQWDLHISIVLTL